MTKIGVFDSGLGGLTVLADIRRLLPKADLIYIGDSANAPYGERSKGEIVKLSEQNIDYLISKGAEVIVIACNTATSAAGERLRAKYKEIQIIGLEPALKPAVKNTVGGKIIVLATNYTLSHKKYYKLVERFAKNKPVIPVAAPELVRLVELGKTHGPEVQRCLKKLIKSTDDVEGVVLGCTHFLHIKPALKEFFKSDIRLFDGNSGVAKRITSLLPNANSGDSETKIINSDPQKIALSNKIFEEYLNK